MSALETAKKNIQARIDMLRANAQALRGMGENETAEVNEAQMQGLVISLQMLAHEGL